MKHSNFLKVNVPWPYGDSKYPPVWPIPLLTCSTSRCLKHCGPSLHNGTILKVHYCQLSSPKMLPANAARNWMMSTEQVAHSLNWSAGEGCIVAHFLTSGLVRSLGSPHFSVKATTSAHTCLQATSHQITPIARSLSRENRDGLSERFESVGTLAYHRRDLQHGFERQCSGQYWSCHGMTSDTRNQYISDTIVVCVHHNALPTVGSHNQKSSECSEKLAFKNSSLLAQSRVEVLYHQHRWVCGKRTWWPCRLGQTVLLQRQLPLHHRALRSKNQFEWTKAQRRMAWGFLECLLGRGACGASGPTSDHLLLSLLMKNPHDWRLPSNNFLQSVQTDSLRWTATAHATSTHPASSSAGTQLRRLSVFATSYEA